MDNERKKQLKKFQENIGVTFDNIKILNTALTHSSFANQHDLSYNDHNERLEFLGDSILSLVVSEYLYKRYQTKHEGKLTRIRAGVVCESSLADMARKLNLNSFLRIGKGEEMSGGRDKDSMLADACEALIAAIYLDRGLQSTYDFVLGNMSIKIESISKDYNYNDYKSKLQEYVQKNILSVIKYTVSNEEGPAHNKTFEIEVYLDDKRFGVGRGKSKKEAEQLAAKNALVLLGVIVNE